MANKKKKKNQGYTQQTLVAQRDKSSNVKKNNQKKTNSNKKSNSFLSSVNKAVSGNQKTATAKQIKQTTRQIQNSNRNNNKAKTRQNQQTKINRRNNNNNNNNNNQTKIQTSGSRRKSTQNQGYTQQTLVAQRDRKSNLSSKKKTVNNTFISNLNKAVSGNQSLPSRKEIKETTKKVQNEQAKRNTKTDRQKLNEDLGYNLTVGNLQQILGSHAVTIGTAAELSSKSVPVGSSGAGAAAANLTYLKHPEIKKADEEARKEGDKAISKFGSKQIEKGTKKINRATKDMSDVGKFFAEAYGAGIGMTADAGANMVFPGGGLASLASRSFGSSYKQAKDESANDEQATNNALGQAGKEVGSELMWSVGKPFKAIYGTGVGDDLAEALVNKISKKVSSKKLKNLVYHGGKSLISAVTEGIEEMVAEGLDPVIANKTYAEAVGNPHSTTAKDVLYAGALGGFMGGVLGGAGQVVDYSEGKRVENIFGEDGVKALADNAAAVDDKEKAAQGAAISETIKQGGAVAAGQAKQLYQTVYEQTMKDEETYDVVNTAAENTIKRRNLTPIIGIDADTGMPAMGKTTEENYNQTHEKAVNAINEMSERDETFQLAETSRDSVARAVAAIQTGVADANDINLFMTNNAEARMVYEEVTGEKLPDSNSETRSYLFEKLGENKIKSAEIETENLHEVLKGAVQQDAQEYYGSTGQEALGAVMDTVNVTDSESIGDTLITFNDYYRAGANDIPMNVVAPYANPAWSNVDESVAETAWNAGREDAKLERETKASIRQAQLGKTAAEVRSKTKAGARRGRVYSELSTENRSKLTGSQHRLLRALARAFNIDIRVVDKIKDGINGYYHEGEMYISVSGDRAIEYIFSHEITHHMQDYAPEEYNKLKELIRETWTEEGGLDDAVALKKAQYAADGIDITREEALDEIIADATYEMLNDETFADEVCAEHRSIAQAILDAIKAVLKKLRIMLADGESFTPKQNAGLLSQLDILKECEKIWTDGLARASENRYAVGADTASVSEDSRKWFSLKNKNITPQEKIPYTIHKSYIAVKKNDYKSLKKLQDDVKKLKRGTYENKATGYRADINGETIGKILSPSMNSRYKWSAGCIDNLNASIYLPELFEKAIYIDTKPPQKQKNAGKQIKGFHHFVAPIYMNNKEYRVRITAREKWNSDTLYLVEAKVLNTKSGARNAAGQKPPTLGKAPLDISIQDLVNGVKIYDYNKQKNDVYCFSDVKFSLKEPVEQTKNLIAVHNIGEDELLKTTKLGGFPMPSIAVTKAEMGHTMYGAISVLFSKDTIDPEASRYNKVYSGDAYTPEFPHVDYEVDSKKGKQLQKYIENIIGDDLKDSSMGPYLDSNNLEDKINRQSGDFVEAYMNNEAMMYAFMKEREGDVELPQREVSFSHGGKYTNEQVKKFAEIFPEKELNDIYALGGPEISEYYERNPEKIELVREARNRDFREKHKSFAERFAEKNGTEFEYYKEVDFADFDNLLLSLLRYYEEGDTSKLDTAALGETVRAYTAEHNDEYLKWLAAISDGVVAGSGIRNEKDEFTSGARKRSFKALHDDVNLENVVKAMRRDAQTGSGIGGYSFMGSVTREYGSVDDIKSDTDRLRLEDMKTYNEYIDDIKSSVAEIAERLSEANPYIRVHDIESCIAEAVAKRKTKSGMKNFLEKELDIPADVDMGAVVTEILKLKERAQKLPTGYFEAKPQRVIAFDEVKAVIAPDSISEELKTAIEDAGMELYEYEAGNDEDRIAEVNEAAAVKNVRFSISDNVSDYSKEEYNRYGWAVANKLLSREEMAVFKKQVGDKARGDIYQIRDGLHIIPTGERELRNVLVYTDGNFERPSIDKIIRINLDDGTDIEAVTEDIYNEEQQAIGEPIRTYEEEGILDSFEARDYDYAEWKRRRKTKTNRVVFRDSEGEQDGRGSDSENQTNGRKYSLKGFEGKASLPESGPVSEDAVIDYMAEHETEFSFISGPKDYEIKKRQVRIQTREELEAQVEKLRAEMKITKGQVLDEKSVRGDINDMVKMLMTHAESYTPDGRKKKTDRNLVAEGVNAAQQIFNALKRGQELDAITKAEMGAVEIVENLNLVGDLEYYEYKDLRDYLRKTKIRISEEDANNIADFKAFKKANAGKLRITTNEGEGISVDSVYESLLEEYPGMFDEEITHPADRLQEIADARDSLEPYDIMLSDEYTEQLVKQTAQELLDIAAGGKSWKSFADKYEDKIKMLKERQAEAMRDVKANLSETKKSLKKAERKNKSLEKKVEKANEKTAKEKERGNERVAKEKEKANKRVAKQKRKDWEKQKEKEWLAVERAAIDKAYAERDLQREKQKRKEENQKRKENAERKKLRERIEKNVKWLSDRIAKPSDDKHVPEILKKPLAELLSTINLKPYLQTSRSKHIEETRGQEAKRWSEMDELKSRLAEIAKEDSTGEFEYDGHIFEVMEDLAKSLNSRTIETEATTEQLEELDDLIAYIVHSVNMMNEAFAEDQRQKISELAGEAVSSARQRQSLLKDAVKRDRTGLLGQIDRILNESMVTPRDFFEIMGGGMNKCYKSLRHGFDKYIDNMTATREFFEKTFKAYNKKKKPGSTIEKWRNGKETETFEVSGGKITLTPAQVMSLYCLSKREQAMGHILGSGIIADKVDAATRVGRIIGAKEQVSGGTVVVSYDDVIKIIGNLTEEQRNLADSIQSYLSNECSELGNETSMRLYGYRKFTEKNYFPIKSYDAFLDSRFDGHQAEERIKNFGFTKGTVVNANNPIVIADIFSVAADHINKMNLYNAFAAPIADFTRVYNYRTKNEEGLYTDSVKKAITEAYGKKPGVYIQKFMSDVNGQVKIGSDGLLRFVTKSLANYKKSAIAGNIRVALQQPTAITRAFVLISPKYFVNGSFNVAKNMKDMQEHCQIARWKSWGFSQVDMAADIDKIMMNKEWSKIDVLTMEIYGKLDDLTWSTIWAAVRREAKAKHPEVKVDSEEFYEICNERASEIFDRTQVVDSVFHRSQAMRNEQVLMKMVTSFMSEPTRTFNMVRTELVLGANEWATGNKIKGVRRMVKATNVYILSATATAAAAAIADAMRNKDADDDDDDGNGWFENFLSNLKDGIAPWNLIPVIKDFSSYADGYSAKNMAMEGWEKLVQGTRDFIEEPTGENFFTLLDGLGYVTGLPIRNVRRDGKAIMEFFGFDASAAEKDKKTNIVTGTVETVKNAPGRFSRWAVKDGSWLDNKLNEHGWNLTDEEKKKWDFQQKVNEAKQKVKDSGLTGKERKDKAWDVATDGYTKYIAKGDMKSVRECRKILKALGGDVELFDERVAGYVKSNYKKNIGADGDPSKLAIYKDYLINKAGMTEGGISAGIVAKSETATAFQMALCEDDYGKAVEQLRYLIDAGITYADGYLLFENKYDAIDEDDYATGEMVFPASGSITSSFGYRNAPTAGASTYHEGIDIGAAYGSDVAAADGGKVTKAGWNGGYGYQVEITHANGVKTYYSHLSGYYVQVGQAVNKGETIAAVGSTGTSTGPHLDFRVMVSGSYVDPMIYFR